MQMKGGGVAQSQSARIGNMQGLNKIQSNGTMSYGQNFDGTTFRHKNIGETSTNFPQSSTTNDIYAYRELNVSSDEIIYKIALDVPIIQVNYAIISAICNVIIPGSGTIFATCVQGNKYSQVQVIIGAL